MEKTPKGKKKKEFTPCPSELNSWTNNLTES